MNVLIVYHSKGGRTAKVAQEIYDSLPDEKAIIRTEPTEKESVRVLPIVRYGGQ
jgi:flavodoxin